MTESNEEEAEIKRAMRRCATQTFLAMDSSKFNRAPFVRTTDLKAGLIEENQRYLKIEQEDGTVYAAYFTINSIVGELDFPSSEIFYYQQQQFTFPIDTSMNVEIVTNRKALITLSGVSVRK